LVNEVVEGRERHGLAGTRLAERLVGGDEHGTALVARVDGRARWLCRAGSPEEQEFGALLGKGRKVAGRPADRWRRSSISPFIGQERHQFDDDIRNLARVGQFPSSRPASIEGRQSAFEGPALGQRQQLDGDVVKHAFRPAQRMDDVWR
jgi:hypothetical protein